MLPVSNLVHRLGNSRLLALLLLLQDPNCRVTALGLSANFFGDEGAESVAEALRVCLSILVYIDVFEAVN